MAVSTQGQAGMRPDLSRSTLLALLGILVPAIALVLFVGGGSLPGTPPRQTAAAVGSLLLLAPTLFSIVKRVALTASPPIWFVVHVLASALGIVLIAWHIAGGDWLSPPGLLVLALVFLVFQGALARAFLALDSSRLFASRLASFQAPDPARRARIAGLIADKEALLRRLDPNAAEALFSPHLAHWLRHPILTLGYVRLAAAEARLVGTRAQATPLLAHWRRAHIAVAYLFLIGLLLHVVLVIFFAGYVSQGSEVYWWHLANWGGPE